MLRWLLALGLVSSVVCTGFGAAAATAEAPTQATLYVSAEGSGASCSISAPCSITQARSAVEGMDGSMTGDIVVYLRGGAYRLSSTFALGPEDSGSNGYSVDWEAYPGQTPVLAGSEQVTGWSEYNSSLGIWRASVPVGTQSRQLYVDGVEASRAAGAKNPGGFSVSGTSFITSSPAYLSWTDVTQTEVVDDNDWKEMRCPLQSITETSSGGSSLNVDPACFDANSTDVGFPFNGNGLPAMDNITWIEDNYALLTQPGQWYLDGSGGYLYYIPLPGQNMATADVELPVLQEVLDLSGAPGHLAPTDCTAPGISYSGTSWSYASGTTDGDYDDNYYSTAHNGDAVSYTFNGSGIEVLSEVNSDEGDIGVYVDGLLYQTVDAYGPGLLAQQAIVTITGLAAGSHTVKLVKESGTEMLLNAFVVIPTAFQSVHDISFSGVTFEYTTWNAPTTQGYIDNQAGIQWSAAQTPVKTPAAVQVHRGDDITLSDDVISDVGDTGVDFADGTQNSSLVGSTVTDTAANGVNLGEADDYYETDTALMTLNDTITENDITHNGLDYHDGVGLWAGFTRGAVISHNDIGFEPYGGINFGWGWGWQSPCSMQEAQGIPAADCRHGTDYAGGNEIEDNYVFNPMLQLNDNAFIYVLGGQGGGNGTLTSVIAGNVLFGEPNPQTGIYLDEGSSYWDIYDNAIDLSTSADADDPSGPGTWTWTWTPTINNLTYGVNYADVSSTNMHGTDIDYTAPTVITNGAWPQSIIENAGPSSQYQPLTGMLDDTCLCAAYNGTSWYSSMNRGLGDYDDDVHVATGNGDSFTVSFTGTAIAWIGETNSDEGTAEVYLDGVDRGSYDAYSSSRRTRQVIFSANGLPDAAHTLQVVKTGGANMLVDAVDVTGTATVGTGGSTGMPAGYHTLTVASDGLCLDGYGDTANAGAIIDQWACNGGANQEFEFVPVSAGGYGELQVENSGQDVAVLNSSTAQGVPDIAQEPSGVSSAALWLPQQQSDGSWQFENDASGLCLDVYGASGGQGQQLDQWPCKNGPGTNQDFVP